MTRRATKRPDSFEKPDYWSDEKPPKPAPPRQGEPDEGRLSPTRYGDWVKNGIAIDF